MVEKAYRDPQMANFLECTNVQQGEGVDDMHLEQGEHVSFTENALYTELGAVSRPLDHGLFNQALQRYPYSYSNTNGRLLPDSFFGMQPQSLDTEFQPSSRSQGPQNQQNGQVQANFITANFVPQSSSFVFPSVSDQIFAETLFSPGNNGETTLFTPSCVPDPLGTDKSFSFVDTEASPLQLAETVFTEIGRIPSSQLIPHQTPLPGSKRKRSKFDDEGKMKVKKVRKRGACFRCKIYKLSYDEEIHCMNCLKVKDKQNVFRGPCIRPNIFDVQSFRAGDGDNGQLRSILPEYKWIQGGQTKMVKLKWPFRRIHVNNPILEVACQMFKPMRGQNTAEEFSINNREYREVPRRMPRATGRRDKNDIEDKIMRDTWAEALRYRAAHKSTLVTRALQVFAGAMMNSKYPMSLEKNVFGVPDELDNTPHFFEKLPLPAQLTYQVQTMIAHDMLDTQTPLLKELKSRIFHKDRQRHWYEVYLTIFILLASIEFVYRAQMRFVRAKAGISDRNLTNIAFVTQAMLDEWESSAHNLINHFRCIMHGELPLDPGAVEYIRAINSEIEVRMDGLRALRDLDSRMRFEMPLGAICELFLPSKI
ncbi:hypothetical protein GGR58DRAFT_506010 [Xylaria digitata]|nr:hypothetical protein GGR58DRAFT_506010 [Xylaria digitata]